MSVIEIKIKNLGLAMIFTGSYVSTDTHFRFERIRRRVCVVIMIIAYTVTLSILFGFATLPAKGIWIL